MCCIKANRPTHRRRRRDSTVELSRVGGVTYVNAPVGSRDPVCNNSRAVKLLRLVTSDDIMTSLLKKLSTSIKIGEMKPLWIMESVWSVSNLSTESVGIRRELVANCVHTADATQLDS